MNAFGKNDELVERESAIVELIEKIALEENFTIKNALNNELISLFYDALLADNSFEYPFDSLNNIGNLKSSDNRFRIFTWNIPQSGGLQRYFGFIQININGKIEIYPLTDNRKSYEQPHAEIGNSDKWYGALYYSISDVKVEGETFYTLLGVELNNMFSTKRVIEVIHIQNNGEPVFGHPIFKIKNQTISRVIFEYSSRANMVLKWEKDLNMIVFDHLSPLRPDYIENYQFYVPDFSFDAFKFVEPYWEYTADIDIRNPQREKPQAPTQAKEFDEPGFIYRSGRQSN
ncbi:MAG: hypothetical protein CVT98_04275 [Bacteroidetes bacterium HGW-Bacteroidetes-15]|nr:MAG: hypothetical protein CVT98_04275 [Bacteroidetes bacterium HGW-Bacteroidetes-15]